VEIMKKKIFDSGFGAVLLDAQKEQQRFGFLTTFYFLGPLLPRVIAPVILVFFFFHFPAS